MALAVLMAPAFTSGQSQDETGQATAPQDFEAWRFPKPNLKIATRPLMLISDGSAVRV